MDQQLQTNGLHRLEVAHEEENLRIGEGFVDNILP